MPEGKKNTAPVPAPVRDEDGYSAKTHLHQPVQETATVAATALLADAPEGALPSEVRPEIVTWEKLCEAIRASGRSYNMEAANPISATRWQSPGWCWIWAWTPRASPPLCCMT